MKKNDYRLKDNQLLSCPFCGGKLRMHIHDDTLSRFCNGSPCWKGGATCPACGKGIDVGTFSWGITVDEVEKQIIKSVNQRPKE